MHRTGQEDEAMARGPAYPYIDLESAIEQLQKLFNYAKRGPAAISELAKEAWGWSPTSSTPIKVVAALRYFGLIDEIAGDRKQVKISDRGYRILVDAKDSPARVRALQDAALSPAPYQYVYQRWGLDVPPAAKSVLIFERGFVPNTVDGFLRDYLSTMAFAGVTGAPDANGGTDSPPNQGAANKLESSEVVTQGALARPSSTATQLPRKAASEGQAMRQDVFSIEEGSVTIEWPAVLSQESLSDIEEWLTIIKRKISRSVPKAADDGKEAETGQG
jgi:hypothetical protein